MIEVVIHKPGTPERRIQLQGGVYTMGRHEQNDIVLDDREVSRNHARLLVDGDTVVLEDLQSGNGTYIDGNPIAQVNLRPGVEVEVLPFTFQLQRIAPEAPPPVPTLVVIDGPATGSTFELVRTRCTLGRGDDQDFVLDDAGASRSHAALQPFGDGWSVRDLDSANGVFVNDVRIVEAPIEPGDEITVGNSRLRFELIEPEPEEELEFEDAPTDVGDADADLILEDEPTVVGSPFATQPMARPAAPPVVTRVTRRPVIPDPPPAPPVVAAPVAAPAAPPAPYAAAPAPAPPNDGLPVGLLVVIGIGVFMMFAVLFLAAVLLLLS